LTGGVAYNQVLVTSRQPKTQSRYGGEVIRISVAQYELLAQQASKIKSRKENAWAFQGRNAGVNEK
jgi:hypothetical protein